VAARSGERKAGSVDLEVVGEVTGTLRVLIVADTESHATAIVDELRRTGREISSERVDNDVGMRAVLARDDWDVVISDWTLISFSALRALRVLKELGLLLPFIVVSGTIGDEAAFDLMREGAHDFVLKDNLARLAPSIARELLERDGRAARKRMSDELGASEDRYRRIVETTNDGVWIIDGEGRTTFMNQQMAVMLGYTVAQIGHRAMTDFIHASATDDTVVGPIAHRDSAGAKYPVTFVRHDGTPLATLVDSKPIIGKAGAFEGVLNMVIDLTAQRAAELALRYSEDQLRQAQKMEAVGRLAGGVAHDFNNQLSVILSFTEFLADNPALGSEAHSDVQGIRNASLRAAELTRQLLTFSRQDVIEARVVDVQTHLSGMVKMLPRLLGEDVVLISRFDPTTGHILADPGQIEQVVMNLAVNARDAMPSGGTLTIDTENVELSQTYALTHLGASVGPHVMITVSDTGLGMDPKILARIFEPFFTTKEVGKGTGLGLATVFGIAQRAGGSVDVVSQVGVGTTFRVYFPRVAARTVAPEPAVEPTNLRGTETILLVEDEVQVRAVASTILRRNGYLVLEANSAREALRLSADATHIDLLLSDVVMPEMSGLELAQRLSRLRPTMKILCMSGYTEDNRIRHEVVEGDIAFLQKPFTGESLRRKVRLVLDARTVTQPVALH
jgi:PAS domain S-box-containing protein